MWNKIKSFLLVNQSVRQTVVKNIFWLSAGQIAGRLIRAILIIYAARELGAASWGAFSYALSLAAFLTLFSELGIASLITREGSIHPELRSKYLATAFLTNLTLVIIGAFIFMGATYYFIENTEVLSLVPIVIFLTIFDTLRNISLSMARAAQRFELEAWVNILTNVSILSFGLGAMFLYKTSLALMVGYTIGSGIGLVATIYSVREYFKGLFKNFMLSWIRPMISRAWPFGFAGLMGVIMLNTDVILLNFFRSIEEVGFYTAGQKIIALLYILPGFIIAPLLPVLSKLTSDQERFRKILGTALRTLLVAALPLSAGGVILGKEIIFLLFGEEYLPAYPAFQILSLTLLTTFFGTALGSAIFAAGRQRLLIIYASIGIIGNALLDVILIPKFGMVGLATSTLTVQLIITAYAYIKLRDLIDIKQIINFGKPVIATLIMAFVIFLLKSLPVVAVIIVGGIIYFSILWMLKEPSLLEIKSILR